MTEDTRLKMSDEAFHNVKKNIVMMVDKDVVTKKQANDVLKGCIVMLESMGYQIPASWPIIIWSGRSAYDEFKRMMCDHDFKVDEPHGLTDTCTKCGEGRA